MSTSLAGNNILVVDKNKQSAKSLADSFSAVGANIFLAHDVPQGQAIQEKWDIDVVVADVSLLAGLGDLVSQSPARWSGKSAPLIFGYGKCDSQSQKILSTRGVLRIFPSHKASDVIEGITHFLFDPKEHIRSLAMADQAKQISLVLQNAMGQWALDVQQLSAEGLSGLVEGSFPQGETAVLTIVFPDGEQSERFSVRVESIKDGKENIRLKVLFKEQDRWKTFLKAIESRQSAIDNFLLMSSGR